MLRAAICFFGGLGGYLGKNGIGQTIDPSIGFNTILNNIVIKNPQYKFDYFLHSWTISKKERILETINPISWNIEEQIDFSNEIQNYKDKIIDLKDFKRFIKLELMEIVEKYILNKQSQKKMITFRNFSRWYSVQCSNNLKKVYEEKNNFKYDLVISSRFDLYLKSSLDLNNLDLSLFYSSAFRPKTFYNNELIFDNRNLQDQWFFSNSKNMDLFCNLYQFINDYSRDPHRCSYQHALKNFGKKNLSYILQLEKDYDIVRNVILNN